MQRITALLAGALVLVLAGPALAIGLNYGARLGVGTGFGSGSKAVEDTDFSSFVVGGALKVDLVLLGIEVDLLYNRVTADEDTVSTSMSVPVIGTLSIPAVPLLLDINLGIGLEPRFHLATEFDGTELKDDPTEDMVLYLPLVLGGTISLGVLDVDAQIRYVYQLTEAVKDNDDRVHHLMFMAGAFF